VVTVEIHKGDANGFRRTVLNLFMVEQTAGNLTLQIGFTACDTNYAYELTLRGGEYGSGFTWNTAAIGG